jgi:hypothetical protein
VCLIVCDLETSKQGSLNPTWAVVPQKKEEEGGGGDGEGGGGEEEEERIHPVGFWVLIVCCFLVGGC